jgi:anhydro-N-acetylmuramic acid kinase
VQAELGRACDEDGRLAGAGRVLEDAAAGLRADPFFARPLPRSTGLERFGPALARRLRAAHPQARIEDLLATLVEFAAYGVASTAAAMGLPSTAPIYFCGGGAANVALMTALGNAFGAARLRPYAELGPPGDLRADGGLREAVAFALLADAFLAGEPACWPSTTGCREPAVLGSWTPAPGRRHS